MSYGVQVWDGAGKIALDTSTSLTRQLGTIHIPNSPSTGNFQDLRLLQGEPYFYLEAYPQSPIGLGYPSIVISGSTISWRYYSADMPYNVNFPLLFCNVVYGVFS